jgi:hypothetical protein
VASQDRSHARLRHTDAELPQFAEDAEVAPAGVLPCEATDQRNGLFGQGRTTWSSVGVGPVLLHDCTVPCQDRLWHDEERSPPLTRYEVGQKSDQGTVGPGEAGTADLSAQHGQLVAQHEGISPPPWPRRPPDGHRAARARDGRVGRGRTGPRRASLTACVMAGQARMASNWTLQGRTHRRRRGQRSGGQGRLVPGAVDGAW